MYMQPNRFYYFIKQAYMQAIKTPLNHIHTTANHFDGQFNSFPVLYRCLVHTLLTVFVTMMYS